MDIAAANLALKCMFGDTRSAEAPATWTVVLYDGDPNTTGVELPTGGGYAPKPVANSTANWPDPDNGAIVATPLDWGTSTGAWPDTATYLGLKDASGNLWYSRALTEPIAVEAAGVAVPPVIPVVTMNQQEV